MIELSILPTHSVAKWLLSTIDGMLNRLGLEHHGIWKEIIYVAIISAFSILIGIALKKLILYVTRRIMAIKQSAIGMELHNRNVFVKCSHIIPPLVFMALVPFAFNENSELLHWIFKIVGIYTLIAFAMGVSSILEFIFDRYNQKDNRKNLPLKGILNTVIGIVWTIILILSVCILFNKSPGALLAGLGAFAAALMLIFKDSILGFVAGIQMSENDMLHVGDWIVVPGTPANGIVLDVSLSTVKIQNWDLTTVMVPPYTLVSTSFQNYKSMYDAGARHIDYSLIIDLSSVKTLTEAQVDEIVAKYPVMQQFVQSLRSSDKKVLCNTGPQTVNGSIETNLGLYRAYAGIYLTTNPLIDQTRQVMVRIMAPTNAGVPMQLYCFTATTEWTQYQAIQSAIFEHLAAIAADFAGLTIYSANNVDINNTPITFENSTSGKTISASINDITPDTNKATTDTSSSPAS